jgi:hypothetical protein
LPLEHAQNLLVFQLAQSLLIDTLGGTSLQQLLRSQQTAYVIGAILGRHKIPP